MIQNVEFDGILLNSLLATPSATGIYGAWAIG